MALICFSHGKESGPNATKISALAAVAEAAGHQTLSIDYRGMDDPQERINKLISSLKSYSYEQGSLVLVGSSMGGYVSIFASRELNPCGLFLLAPAVYMPGYEEIPAPPSATFSQIYHGWSDEIVPVENAIRFAKAHKIESHILQDDHRLSDSLPRLEHYFKDFLTRLFK